MIDVDEVRERLEAQAARVGSQKRLAKKIGVSASYISDILLGKREPAGKVLEFLGLTKTVKYVDNGRR